MTGQRVSHHDKCFGCGAANPDGLQADWHLAEDDTLHGSFLVHEGLQGPPGYAHGGIMAAALDEAMSLLVHGLGTHNVTSGFEVRLVAATRIGTRVRLKAGFADQLGDERTRAVVAEALDDHTGRLLATARARIVADARG